MGQSGSKTAEELDFRTLFLSCLTLFLTLPLLLNWHVTWTATPPILLTVFCAVCLLASLYAGNKTKQLLLLAGGALIASLLWTWREALTNLLELLPGIASIFVVTLIGQVLYIRIRPLAKTGFQAAVGLSALPVALVCGCYLLLSAVFGLVLEDVSLLIGMGLAITYFNLGATLFSGGPPLDGGVLLPDGTRLLGDGKTWRGSLLGVASSMAAYTVFAGSLATGLLFGLVALVGDASASFLKRRFGREQSRPVPFLDQVDGLLPLLYILTFFEVPFILPPGSIPILLIGTIFIQFAGNHILFELGRKSVPW